MCVCESEHQATQTNSCAGGVTEEGDKQSSRESVSSRYTERQILRNFRTTTDRREIKGNLDKKRKMRYRF